MSKTPASSQLSSEAIVAETFRRIWSRSRGLEPSEGPGQAHDLWLLAQMAAPCVAYSFFAAAN